MMTIKEILETQKIADRRFWEAHRAAWDLVRNVPRETPRPENFRKNA